MCRNRPVRVLDKFSTGLRASVSELLIEVIEGSHTDPAVVSFEDELRQAVEGTSQLHSRQRHVDT